MKENTCKPSANLLNIPSFLDIQTMDNTRFIPVFNIQMIIRVFSFFNFPSRSWNIKLTMASNFYKLPIFVWWDSTFFWKKKTNKRGALLNLRLFSFDWFELRTMLRFTNYKLNWEQFHLVNTSANYWMSFKFWFHLQFDKCIFVFVFTIFVVSFVYFLFCSCNFVFCIFVLLLLSNACWFHGMVLGK